MPTRKPIPPGEKFFRLTVISDAPSKKSSTDFPIYCVWAQCECGNKLIVAEYKLRAKHTKSCGCFQVEKARKNLPPPKHGYATGNPKSFTLEYKAWLSMKNRCGLKEGHAAFKHYGGKGITICERWNDFENFFADMGKHPGEGYSLDRINSNGNYEFSNCRWADYETQTRNRNIAKNVTINGVEMCIAQAVKVLNTHESKICKMVKKLNITHQQAVDLLMIVPRPVNIRQFKEILEKGGSTLRKY